MEEVVRVDCIRHTYQDQTTLFICGLDFVVHRGERIVVAGPNGSGKTTLLNHIFGLLKPEEGSVRVFGHDPAREWNKIRERIGVLLQNVEDQIVAPTVWDDISFGPRNYGYDKARVTQMVEEVMAQLDIGHLRQKVPHYLSGGEKRKVALAGALVLQPELLILDEPFEGLDPRSREELLSLLNHLNEEKGMTLILTTHDVNIAALFADYVYILVMGGQILQRGSPAEVFTAPDLLAASHLEPPILTQLFQRLQDDGVDLGMPITVEDAAARLKPLLGSHKANSVQAPKGKGQP